MGTEQQLLNLKQEIEDAKTELAETQGKLKYLQKQLAEDFNCATIDEANTLVERKEAEANKLKQQIDKGIAKIEEKYEL